MSGAHFLVVWILSTLVVHAGTPTLVKTVSLPGKGDLQAVTIADDGTIYVAGNTVAAEPALTLGTPSARPLCGHGFVARYSPDGSRQLAYTQFAEGIALVTSVAANSNGVYVGGYATEGLAALIASSYPLAITNRLATPKLPDGHETPKGNRVPTPPPGLGSRGAPFVVRLPATLERIESGRYLEGWQQVWDIPRVKGYVREWAWQPTGIGFLANGDVVVAHDGGYDRGLPAGTPAEAKENFNHVCDYLSRLSPDLSQRRWRKEIYTPRVTPAASAAVRPWWKHETYGNPRLLRLRTDGSDTIYIGGWSASATAREPWWCPFLWKLDGAGKVVWKAYSPDPLSGDDYRLNGLVSDAGVSSVALDDDGNLLVTTIGDGGNSVLRQDPLDWRQPARGLKGMVSGFKGRLLFWGTAVRLDQQTGALVNGNHIAGNVPGKGTIAAWGIDAVALPGGRMLVVGRHFDGFRFTPDAWQTNESAGAFLRVYSPAFDVQFSTSVPGLIPFGVARHGERCAVAGELNGAGCLLVADFPE